MRQSSHAGTIACLSLQHWHWYARLMYQSDDTGMYQMDYIKRIVWYVGIVAVVIDASVRCASTRTPRSTRRLSTRSRTRSLNGRCEPWWIEHTKPGSEPASKRREVGGELRHSRPGSTRGGTWYQRVLSF